KREAVPEDAGPEPADTVAVDVLCGSGDGDTVAKSRGERPQDERLVQVHVVGTDDDAWLLDASEVLPTADSDRVANLQCREESPAEEAPAHETRGLASRPRGDVERPPAEEAVETPVAVGGG